MTLHNLDADLRDDPILAFLMSFWPRPEPPPERRTYAAISITVNGVDFREITDVEAANAELRKMGLEE